MSEVTVRPSLDREPSEQRITIDWTMGGRAARPTQSVAEFLEKLDGDPCDSGWRVPPKRSFAYELHQLTKACEELSRQPSPYPRHVYVAILEAFLLHARNLLDFFYPDPKRLYADDVTALTLVPWWPKTRSDLSEEDRGLSRAINKLLSHVTASRPIANVKWDIAEIHAKIIGLVREFESAGAAGPPPPPQRLTGRPARMVVKSGGPIEATIEGARDLRDRISHDLFAAFLKCFHGVDRLLALEQVIHFTQKSQDQGSFSYSRNLRLLVNTLSSTVYETAKALQELRQAGVIDRLGDKSLWEPVDSLRRKWQGDARLARMRNTFGFHLGDIDLYERGLEDLLQSSDEHVLEATDGEKRHDGESQMAVNALLAGVKMDPKDLDAVLNLTWDAHTTLPDLLYAVWWDVLETAGVEIVNLA